MMLTKCKIASVCLGIILVALGCNTNSLQARKQAALDRKTAVENALKTEAASGAFDIQGEAADVQGPRFDREMLSLEADDTTVYATTRNGLLFLIDAAHVDVRAVYDAGSNAPIVPPVVKGSHLTVNYLYLVHDNSIHAVANPEGRGTLKYAWVIKHDGVITTPLCDAGRMLFFGDQTQRVYALMKGATQDETNIRLIDHLQDAIHIAPITEKHIGTPYFIDDSGNVYRFGGSFESVLKPLTPAPLGPVEIPALIDEPTNTLLVATSDYKIHAVGRDKWNREVGAKPVGTMYIYNRAVYVINENAQLQAFCLDNTPPDVLPGKPVWGDTKISDVKKIVSQGPNFTLYVLRGGDKLAKLDTATGNIIWERQLPKVDFVVVNRYGPVVYVGIKEGYVWALMPH